MRRVGVVLVIVGLVMVGLVLLAGACVGGKSGVDRSSPPDGGPAPTPTASTTVAVPPTTTTGTSCEWGWKGGELTVKLLHNGVLVRRWVLPLSLTTNQGGDWGVEGSVNFKVDSCGNEFHYLVIVFATVYFEGPAPSPTVTPTTTTTYWNPPNINPPNHSPIVPLSVAGGMRYELFKKEGESSGEVHLTWSTSLSRVLASLPPGKYDVKVWCQVNYLSLDGAHSLTKYSDFIDLGSFTVGYDGAISYG